MSSSCPKCGSDQTKKLSLIYMAGTHAISSSTIGAAVGRGSSLGVGVAVSSGYSQSLLAQETAPPKKQEALGSCFVIVFGFVGGVIASIISGSDVPFWAVFGGSLLLSFAIGRKAYLYNRYELPDLKEQWGKKYGCLQCGYKFEWGEPFGSI